jgi:hypothetical protein
MLLVVVAVRLAFILIATILEEVAALVDGFWREKKRCGVHPVFTPGLIANKRWLVPIFILL